MARVMTQTERAVEQLREAMKSRAVIEQAKGMLMLRLQCDADEAFQTLVGISQRTQRKLRDVAAILVAESMHSTRRPRP